MRSGLILTGANKTWRGETPKEGKEDGILTAYEIANLNLRGIQLVVLSACETGLGEIDDNEGVFGLQRAFKLAGVDKLMMSLWKIDDTSTVEFMELFYSNYLEEQDIHAAFISTQREMIKNNVPPYYWAGFVLVE